MTFETETATLESRLKELKDLTAAWYARVREHRDRPEALEALRNMLNSSEFFLAKVSYKSLLVTAILTCFRTDLNA